AEKSSNEGGVRHLFRQKKVSDTIMPAPVRRTRPTKTPLSNRVPDTLTGGQTPLSSENGVKHPPRSVLPRVDCDPAPLLGHVGQQRGHARIARIEVRALEGVTDAPVDHLPHLRDAPELLL